MTKPTPTMGAVSVALKEQADDLNASLEAIEAELAPLAVEVSVPMETPAPGKALLLSFRKHYRRWRICLGAFSASALPSEGAEFYPLAEASRRKRIIAIGHLPTLIDAVITQADEQLSELRQAAADAAFILETLRETLAENRDGAQAEDPYSVPVAHREDVVVLGETESPADVPKFTKPKPKLKKPRRQVSKPARRRVVKGDGS